MLKRRGAPRVKRTRCPCDCDRIAPNLSVEMRIVPARAVAVVVLSALGVLGCDRHSSPSPEKAAPVQQKSAAAAPLGAAVHVVRPQPLEVTAPASGRLLARESVEIVSELNRRLVRVRAAEGATIKKGDVLFELDAADVRAELARLDVQIRLATTNAERQRRLVEEGVSTAQEWETAIARQAELEAERRVLGVTLSKTVIRAPFSGTLGLRSVSEGAWVSPTTILASLHDTSELKLDFTLPERYAALVAKGMAFRFKVEGRPETFQGHVAAYEPAVEQSSRSLLVRGLVQNTTALLPGTFASVEFPVRVAEALLVPSIAVVPGADGRRVFVERGGVAKSIKVELGTRTAEMTQVVSGLAPGDRVIVSNLLRIRDGARVATPAK
jgi:membrane fusion protein (multidrug efflux system)